MHLMFLSVHNKLINFRRFLPDLVMTDTPWFTNYVNFTFGNCKLSKSIPSVKGNLTNSCVQELYCCGKQMNQIRFRHKQHDLIPYLQIRISQLPPLPLIQTPRLLDVRKISQLLPTIKTPRLLDFRKIPPTIWTIYLLSTKE